MKIVFIGAVLSSKIILEKVAKKIKIFQIISLSKNIGEKRHADYCNLKEVSKKYKIKFTTCNDNQAIKKVIYKCNPDIVLVMGWSRL